MSERDPSEAHTVTGGAHLPVGQTLFSAANRRRLEHWTWIPDGPGPFPLVLLLHGVYDAGGFMWWQEGHAHETMAQLVDARDVPPAVIVMPSDGGAELGTGYCDWADGTVAVETYLIGELLPWCAANLPVTETRAVTGLSMGGYGAWLLALRHPGTFVAATSTSGFFDPLRLFDFVGDNGKRMWDDDERAAHDVRELVRDATRHVGLRLMLDCGTDDALIDDNRAMHALLDELGVEHGYAEHPGGHTWDYWRDHLAEHLRFTLGARS